MWPFSVIRRSFMGYDWFCSFIIATQGDNYETKGWCWHQVATEIGRPWERKSDRRTDIYSEKHHWAIDGVEWWLVRVQVLWTLRPSSIASTEISCVEKWGNIWNVLKYVEVSRLVFPALSLGLGFSKVIVNKNCNTRTKDSCTASRSSPTKNYVPISLSSGLQVVTTVWSISSQIANSLS